MSAWLCSDYHLNALATFAADQRLHPDPEALSRQLFEANKASLQALYRSRAEEYFGLTQATQAHVYEDVTVDSVWQVLKAAHCYAYQSCEHDEWSTSEVKAVCDAIEERCCSLLRLDGRDDPRIDRNIRYAEAVWGLDRPVAA